MRGRQPTNIWGFLLDKNVMRRLGQWGYCNAAHEGNVIHAIPREQSGRIVCAKERKAGRVPGIVFQQENGLVVGPKRLLSVETDHIRRFINDPFFLSRTFDLEVHAGPHSCYILEKGRVLPRKVHLCPGTDEILNVVFLWAPQNAKLKVDVPLVFRGEDVSPGLRKGGYLNTIRKTLGYVCPADHIPPYIDVDLSNLDIGEKVLMRDLKVDPLLKLQNQDDSLPVCKIMGTRFGNDATTQS